MDTWCRLKLAVKKDLVTTFTLISGCRSDIVKMRLTALRYAQEFGKLAKIRGIVYYRLSPYEQKPFAGTITHGAPNMVRRVREQILRVMPAIIIGGLTYYWAEEEYYRLNRKNPDDYKDDV